MEPMPRDWDRGAATHSPNQSQPQQQPPHFTMCRDTHPAGVPHTASHGSYVMAQTLAGNVSTSESLALPPSSSPATTSAAANQPPQDPPWSQRVLDNMNDMLLLLTRDGRVLYASPSSVDVAGCKPSRLQGGPLSRFIHDDDRAMFARELQLCIAESRPFHCYFRFHRTDNKPCVVEGRGHPHLSQPVDSRSQPETCTGVFIICRPYLTRSTQLLDAFLEHKIENIRLHQRIAQLRQEEEDDLRTAQPQPQQLWSSPNDSQPSAQLPAPQSQPRRRSLRHSSREAAGSNSNEEAESSDTQASADDDDDDNDDDDDDDADQRTLLSQAAARKQHAEKMAHIDGVEVMTGLHFRNGEWSQGLSTGLHSGRFLQGDLDPDRRKRSKGEYMCTDCGTSDSPEWRKGPEGPKTLCNACGLRWAKKEKRRQDS